MNKILADVMKLFDDSGNPNVVDFSVQTGSTYFKLGLKKILNTHQCKCAQESEGITTEPMLELLVIATELGKSKDKEKWAVASEIKRLVGLMKETDNEIAKRELDTFRTEWGRGITGQPTIHDFETWLEQEKE